MSVFIRCGDIAKAINESKYTSVKDFLCSEFEVDTKRKEVMYEGEVTEKYIRQYYESQTGYKVYVPERTIYKGVVKGRADGLIIGEDGGVEFKLMNDFEDDEIIPDHFYQMYGYMFLYDKSWWDYVRVSKTGFRIDVRRIYFDKEIWENTQLKIELFISHFCKKNG